MRRRSRAGGEPVKTRRRKTAARKRGNALKAGRNRSVSIAGQETVVARLTRERDEALLRETANSEILRLISKSPGDLELVFRTILENATLRLEPGTALRVGDVIHIRGQTTDFTQRVESLEVDHKPVLEVGPNDDFGLKVSEHAREHDVVFKVRL